MFISTGTSLQHSEREPMISFLLEVHCTYRAIPLLWHSAAYTYVKLNKVTGYGTLTHPLPTPQNVNTACIDDIRAFLSAL